MYRLKALLRPREDGFASAYMRELRPGAYELTGTGLIQYLSSDTPVPGKPHLGSIGKWHVDLYDADGRFISPHHSITIQGQMPGDIRELPPPYGRFDQQSRQRLSS